ncbi:hypothetical protein, partial [Burkholderia thailandensis]|uniref:hypothetical protein n=1 Tax=Burkholderia thailandensis TaxID=57975 RepID=UPI001ED8F0A7
CLPGGVARARAARTRMCGGGRDAGRAGARGIRAMLDRRPPVRLRHRRRIVPPHPTKRTAHSRFGGAAGELAGVSPRAGRRCPHVLSSTLSSLVR